MSTMNEAADFFGTYSGEGGGAPGFRFVDVGDTVKGKIISMRQMDQTDFTTGQPILDAKRKNPDGTPMVKKMLQIVLQTELRDWAGCKPGTDVNNQPLPGSEDDGTRAIYVRGWMIGALSDAVREAEAKYPEVGGELAVRLSELAPSGKGNPIKKYIAKYKKPSVGEDFFAQEAVQADASAAASGQAPQSPAQNMDDVPF